MFNRHIFFLFFIFKKFPRTYPKTITSCQHTNPNIPSSTRWALLSIPTPALNPYDDDQESEVEAS
jgi:hypothetical protein